MNRMIGVLTLILACPAAAFAAARTPPKPAVVPQCAAAMQNRDAMLTQMAEMDAKLQRLVDAMNNAVGPAKVDRMATVISELVAQRTVMARQLLDLQPMMVQHMMTHVEIGDSMDDCPMMKAAENRGSAQQH